MAAAQPDTNKASASGDADAGKEKFAGTCAGCHGANAEGASARRSTSSRTGASKTSPPRCVRAARPTRPSARSCPASWRPRSATRTSPTSTSTSRASEAFFPARPVFRAKAGRFLWMTARNFSPGARVL
ncbi:c-type cytochrome [Deinococcus sp. PESE-38]